MRILGGVVGGGGGGLENGVGGGEEGEEEKGRWTEVMGRPWSWVCEDAEMAGAVGEMLRGWGVIAPEGVGIAEEGDNRVADEAWEVFWGRLKEQGERMGEERG